MDVTNHTSGLKFLQDLATIICKECRAEWQWDDTGKPHFSRLTVKDHKTRITFQIDGATLENRDGDAFRDFCAEVLRRCLKTFRPDLKTI
jgi:hypothetical protein